MVLKVVSSDRVAFYLFFKIYIFGPRIFKSKIIYYEPKNKKKKERFDYDC